MLSLQTSRVEVTSQLSALPDGPRGLSGGVIMRYEVGHRTRESAPGTVHTIPRLHSNNVSSGKESGKVREIKLEEVTPGLVRSYFVFCLSVFVLLPGHTMFRAYSRLSAQESLLAGSGDHLGCQRLNLS